MPQKLSRLDKRFHRIARQLTRFDLQKLGPSEQKPVTIDEVVTDLEGHSGTSLFMGYYTHSGLIEVLDRYGITRLLKDKGFSDLHLHMQTDDPFRHVLQLYWGAERDPDRLLVEIVLHEGVVTPKVDHISGLYNVVFIEWLCIQNPLDDFRQSKPRLPGQQRPGLGIAAEIAELLVIMAERLEKDGLVNIPRYYHTAWGARRIGFLFIDPETEGVMSALERDFRDHSLVEATWAIELGLVHREGNSAPFLWSGEEQLLATSEGTKRYVGSKEYKSRCLQAKQSTRFAVDWKAYERRCHEMSHGKVTR
jgi:hypothetical protein